MNDEVYQAKIMHASEARAAFPLINLQHPELTLDLWCEFVRRVAGRSPNHGGLVAITDQRGYIHAVFAFCVGDALRGGTALKVSDVVMARLPGGMLPTAVLARVERLARDLRSGCIQVDLLEGALAPADRDALRVAGFASSGILFSRSLTSA